MENPIERKIFGFKLPHKTVWTKRAKADLRIGLLFLSPWLIGFFAFTLYPMVVSFYYSFTEYHSKRAPDWIGMENYVNLITGMIGMFQYFAQAYVVGGGDSLGRPLNSTLFYSVYLYQNAFLFLKMGYASAMAWILFIIILILTLLLLKVSDRFTYYAG